jgi:hypothetical protein
MDERAEVARWDRRAATTAPAIAALLWGALGPVPVSYADFERAASDVIHMRFTSDQNRSFAKIFA